MDRDILLNKTQIIDRCIERIREEYDDNPENLENFTKQDSIVLNVQRAGEAAIDLAMHIVSQASLGLPKSSREAFELLATEGIITTEIAKNMKAMVGFRNIAVHDYQEINLDILKHIVENRLVDLLEFKARVLAEYL